MDLNEKRCLACEAGVKPLSLNEIKQFLTQLNQWELSDDNKKIKKLFTFKNYYQTIAFVNAIAWMANKENHHPDLEVSFNRCLVNYTTHALDGLSENDFICAAKVDLL